MKLRSIDHICIAVRDLEKTRKIYEEDLGLELDGTYVAESGKIRVARYYVGDVTLELMESTAPDGEVAKFIEKRGEGFFLISYRVDNMYERDLLQQSPISLRTMARGLQGRRNLRLPICHRVPVR